MSIEYTTDSALIKTPQYHKIKECIDSLIKTHGAKSFYGNCVATCDIFQTILSQYGISTKIMECQACIVVEKDAGKNYKFVGYDNYSYPGQIDTHTVLVTEGDKPVIIDLSLGHVLPPDRPFIVERVKPSKEKDVITELQFSNFQITYSEKKTVRLTSVHQKNLLQRIAVENNLQKEVSLLKLFIMAAVSLGLVNFTLNIVLIVLRLFDITL